MSDFSIVKVLRAMRLRPYFTNTLPKSDRVLNRRQRVNMSVNMSIIYLYCIVSQKEFNH